MSQLKNSDPLEDWLFKLFKVGLFLTSLVAVYHLADKELQLNDLFGSLINLRAAKISCLIVGAALALYVQLRPQRSGQM